VAHGVGGAEKGFPVAGSILGKIQTPPHFAHRTACTIWLSDWPALSFAGSQRTFLATQQL